MVCLGKCTRNNQLLQLALELGPGPRRGVVGGLVALSLLVLLVLLVLLLLRVLLRLLVWVVGCCVCIYYM